MAGQFDFDDDDRPRRRSRRDDEPQRIYIENRPRSAFGAGFGGCLGVGCAIVVVVGGLIAAGVYFASRGGKHGGSSQTDEYSGPIESSISEEKRKTICAEFGGWHRVAYDKCEVEFRGVSMENGHVKDRYNQILGTGIARICKEHRVSIDQLLNITKEGRAKTWWSDPREQ